MRSRSAPTRSRDNVAARGRYAPTVGAAHLPPTVGSYGGTSRGAAALWCLVRTETAILAHPCAMTAVFACDGGTEEDNLEERSMAMTLEEIRVRLERARERVAEMRGYL